MALDPEYGAVAVRHQIFWRREQESADEVCRRVAAYIARLVPRNVIAVNFGSANWSVVVWYYHDPEMPEIRILE